MIPLATALPEDSHDGYVAAAYIVFFVLLLIYLAIMSIRLGRTERAVRTLKGAGKLDENSAGQQGETPGQPRERETV